MSGQENPLGGREPPGGGEQKTPTGVSSSPRGRSRHSQWGSQALGVFFPPRHVRSKDGARQGAPYSPHGPLLAVTRPVGGRGASPLLISAAVGVGG